MRALLRLPLVLALAGSACGGARAPGSSAAPARADAEPATAAALRAGVARVDITPPPGVSSFGYGPDAHVTNGYWTRLYCRVFVLETTPGRRVAIVPCDLPVIGALLHREIVERVSDVVPASHVMIAATHTHAGPGHYLESFAYGGVLSTRLPGFDPHMLAFLATRIAQGIRTAAGALRPAAARWGHTHAWRLTRNRSLSAFEANGAHPDFGPPPSGDDVVPEERAVDPRLDVLQLEALTPDGREIGPLGWLVLFAMHPTVLPNTNRLLGGDTHAIASRILESELRRSYNQQARECRDDGLVEPICLPATDDPLVGILNTNEGDVSARFTVGNIDEVATLARGLAARALPPYERDTGWRREIVLDAHALPSHLPHAYLMDGSRRLCPNAEMGNAAGHGASDHIASVDSLLPAESDIDPDRHDCQRPKRALLGALQPALIGRETTRFPSDVVFGLVRLDHVWLSFVPAELTVHAGAMVNRYVTRRVGDRAEPRVVGLANSYMQYVTTEPEYRAQLYEGGSTLYGPLSAEFVAERADILVRAALGQRLSGVDELPPLAYELGPERKRMALAADETPPEELGKERALGGLCRLRSEPSLALCLFFTDAGPATALATAPPFIDLVDVNEQPVSTCGAWPPFAPNAPCDPAGTIDDRGADFRTTVRGRSGRAYRWGTIFRPTGAELSALGRPVALRVGGQGHAPPLVSPLFSLSSLPHDCTIEEAARCALTP